MKGFALGLVLKQRHKVTRKLPITELCFGSCCLLAPAATLGDFMISKQSLFGLLRKKCSYCESGSLVE